MGSEKVVPPPNENTCQVSVILRTRDETRHLATTLRAVQAQVGCPGIELVLVDSGSTDNTLDIARQFGVDQIVCIAPEVFSYGRALNLAAEQASGRILVSLSAHAQPAHEGWMKHLLSHFDTPQVGAVYGRQCPQPGAWPPVIVDYRQCYDDKMLVQQRAEDVFFSNANAAFRKSLWERIPFDERLPSCEDQAWARQVVRLGYWVVYEPEAAVYHSHNEWPVQVYRRRAREERGWRYILGKGRGGSRSFLDAWYLSSKADVFHILETRQKWRWLFLSPLYRFFWALGQWYPYLSH